MSSHGIHHPRRASADDQRPSSKSGFRKVSLFRTSQKFVRRNHEAFLSFVSFINPPVRDGILGDTGSLGLDQISKYLERRFCWRQLDIDITAIPEIGNRRWGKTERFPVGAEDV